MKQFIKNQWYFTKGFDGVYQLYKQVQILELDRTQNTATIFYDNTIDTRPIRISKVAGKYEESISLRGHLSYCPVFAGSTC